MGGVFVEGGELGDDADPEPGRFIATGGIVIYNHAIEIRDRMVGRAEGE